MGYSNNPTPSQGSKDIVLSKLRFAGAVEFGSRALNAHTKNSDYDYAILHSNLAKFLETTQCTLHLNDLNKSFDIAPTYGDNYFIYNMVADEGYVDIVVLEHQEHVDAFSNAVMVTRNTSLLILKDKKRRTEIFRKALLMEGFVPTGLFYKLRCLFKGK